MKQLFQDLWQSEKGSHFGMSMKTYLLKTAKGNALIYYSDALDEISHIKKIGVDYQFISHHHEFTPALIQNLDYFQATLCMHEKGLSYLEQPIKKVIAFNENNKDVLDIKVLFTPGHTDNNICLYYESPFGKNYLFTGDTIYLDRGEFNFLIMSKEGGSNNDLRRSLLELRKLKVDVIMPSVGVGENKAIEVTEEKWHSIIDKLLLKILIY